MHDRGSPTVYTGGAPFVRTRFAPSPTGKMHIGGLRTILFSWLLARRHQGQFLLRIEDTDQNRTVEDAVQELLEGMRWIGIVPDEGPEIGGQAGPYYQSERKAIYAAHIQQLLESEHVYRCFCTKERLDAVRADQQARGLPSTGYDHFCRQLTQIEINEKIAAQMPFVIRLKVPTSGATTYTDALRGAMTIQNSTLEDAVLLKSDGYPTYHFANVIDDHLMGITHVLRGDDWLPSAPLHVLVYQSLDWDVPILAHLPNVMGKDKKKLSKRHGAEPILYYREHGYLPEAVLNYLAFLGWSYDDKTDILSIDQLIESFSLERVHTAGAVFDSDRLLWMNGVYIRQMPIEELVERALPFLERPESAGGLPDSVARPLDHIFLAQVLRLDQERMKTLDEATFLTQFFFEEHLEYPREWLNIKGLDNQQSLNGLQQARDLFARTAQWDHESIEQPMRDLAARLGVKAGPLFMIVRVAVTGRKETPPLFETMQVMGRDAALRRIDDAIAHLQAMQQPAE